MKKGQNSFIFNNVYLSETAVVTGPREKNGPLGNLFDFSFNSLHCNSKTWEKAEMNLFKFSLDILFKKIDKNVDIIIAGDLINQNIISNYVMRDYNIPFLGIYGACSTSVLGMINAALIIDGGNANNIITSASSHYGDAERQYRTPTEYGGAKPNTATSTVTGSASALITNSYSKIKIKKATLGCVIDSKLNNPNDMGSAMAPAAAEVIRNHLIDFDISADYYDLILTGDLSQIGSPILIDILKEYGYNIDINHNDAGKIIYDVKTQEVFAGGSGCACLGVVAFSYIRKLLYDNKIKKVLLVATGALLNPIIINQKETIPAIGHAISLEV